MTRTSRTLEYRDWKRDFAAKKEAVMLGKSLDELDPATTASKPTTAVNPGSSSGLKRQVSRGSQELATVIDSLNKLAELEKRISSLESHNEYDTLKAKEAVSKGRGTIDFKKKRTTTDAGTTRVGFQWSLHI